MIWTDLGNPVPLETPEPYKQYVWPLLSLERLPTPNDHLLPTLDLLIAARRTNRTFGSISPEQLSSFLWLTCRTIAKGDDRLGFPLRQRPTPSAGAIHPIHLVLNNHDNWRLYNPDQHALSLIDKASSTLGELRSSISGMIDVEDACILLFVAEPGMTSAKYSFADSLIWRDAGALLGHMALVAESLELNFCPLGITGEPWIGQLDSQGHLVGVGVALLGAR
jgi:SagB-type dehydrogenase family enzyme